MEWKFIFVTVRLEKQGYITYHFYLLRGYYLTSISARSIVLNYFDFIADVRSADFSFSFSSFFKAPLHTIYSRLITITTKVQ